MESGNKESENARIPDCGKVLDYHLRLPDDGGRGEGGGVTGTKETRWAVESGTGVPGVSPSGVVTGVCGSLTPPVPGPTRGGGPDVGG